MTRLAAWSDVLPGTLVTLRRGPLTGERVERTKAWTAGAPYTESGVDYMPVNTGGVILSYPLDRVSLGYDEPRPVARVPLALALDPPPDDGLTVVSRFFAILVAIGVIYLLGFGLGPVLDWVFG